MRLCVPGGSQGTRVKGSQTHTSVLFRVPPQTLQVPMDIRDRRLTGTVRGWEGVKEEGWEWPGGQGAVSCELQKLQAHRSPLRLGPEMVPRGWRFPWPQRPGRRGRVGYNHL